MVAPLSLLLGLGGGIAIGTQFAPQIKTGTKNFIAKINGNTIEASPSAELQGPSEDTYTPSKKNSTGEEAAEPSSEQKTASEASQTDGSSITSMPSVSETVDQIIGDKSATSVPA